MAAFACRHFNRIIIANSLQIVFLPTSELFCSARLQQRIINALNASKQTDKQTHAEHTKQRWKAALLEPIKHVACLKLLLPSIAIKAGWRKGNENRCMEG